MQILNRGIAGNDDIRVVAEPLQAAIPNIAMDIIIGARGNPKKSNVPHSSQDEPNNHNASGKFWCGAGAPPAKKLTDR
jgi:hypothetical protein